MVETKPVVDSVPPPDPTTGSESLPSAVEEEVIVHSSTPSKMSAAGSYSFVSESMIKNVSS